MAGSQWLGCICMSTKRCQHELHLWWCRMQSACCDEERIAFTMASTLCICQWSKSNAYLIVFCLFLLTQDVPQLVWASYNLLTQRGDSSLGIDWSLSFNLPPFSTWTGPVCLCTGSDNLCVGWILYASTFYQLNNIFLSISRVQCPSGLS